MEQQNELLSALLNDPERLQGALSAAASLLAGDPPAPAPSGADYDPAADLLGKAMPLLTGVLQSGSRAVTPEKKALLQAVKPFLGAGTGTQIDHAMRLVTLAHIASAAMRQFGRKETDHV